MQVTATEFKSNLGRYFELVYDEDILITKNGKVIAKLINPNVSAVDSISGILKGHVSESVSRKTLRDERYDGYEIHD